ncbi:hypothetical protein [Lacrimispora sp. JR3]|uniref:hypothetical protein n=1 Tax=Lacrimispora sinapis TaxID=3111456 RepID=UPI003749D59F
MALPHEVHADVNRAQRQHNARTQTPIENVNANVTILASNSKIPESSVLEAQTKALQHITNTMKRGK